MDPQGAFGRWGSVIAKALEVDSQVPDGEPTDVPLATHEVMTVFARTRSHLSAIGLLLHEGLAEEALSLNRSITTDSLRLQYLADETDTKREAVFIFRHRKALTDTRHKLVNLRHSLGLPADANGLRDIDGRLAELQARASRMGVRPRDYPGDADLAKRFGRQEDYWFASMASEAVHGSQVSLGRRLKITDGVFGVYTRDHDPRLLASICFGSVRSYAHGHIAAASLIGWDSSGASSLLADLSEWDEQLDPDGEPSQ